MSSCFFLSNLRRFIKMNKMLIGLCELYLLLFVFVTEFVQLVL